MSELTQEDAQRLLDKAGLTPRELQVVCARFKLPLPEGMEPLDPEAGRERIRQIEAKALRKIGNARRRV